MYVSLTTIKRTLDCFIIAVFGLISVSLFYRPISLFQLHRKAVYLQENKERRVSTSDDGFIFTSQTYREKFISYEPPIGSWSRQLLAFQNAVIIAALLNRTLLAQPLVSELEGNRLKQLVRTQLKSDSEIYKLVDLKFTVPISAAINLNLLRRLIRVKPIHTTHVRFLQDYHGYSWRDVCHDDSVGFWVDFIPSPKNEFSWQILEAQAFAPLNQHFHGVESVCEQEMKMVDHTRVVVPVLRGILTELSAVEEDVIYFRGGSLATRELRFLSKNRTAHAQMWIMRYIQFSTYVKERVSSIVQSMERPYNAVKLTINDDQEIMTNTIRFRLSEMEKKNFRRVTNRLYVISDLNDTALHILQQHGYVLYSVKDLIPVGISRHIRHDVKKLLGELICKHARYYEGPTDSYMIQRARVHESAVKDGLLTNHISVKWAFHTVNKNYKLSVNTGIASPPYETARDRLTGLFCKICRTMHGRLRTRTCKLIIGNCTKMKVD